jgi:OmpA-OmpF porin, OOP family
MTCNWRRWLWGIVPLLVLSWVAVQAEHGRMEGDLAERARIALSDSGLGWSLAAFQGRDVVLTGRAPQESELGKAADVLRTVWGVRDVDNKAQLLEKAEKYLWWASRRNSRIRLSGYVPSLTARQAILGMAKASFPGFELADRMTLARGIPSTDIWLGGVSFALKQLTSLKHGDARLEDVSLTITGEAEDVAGYRVVKSSLRDGVPKGIKLISEAVTAPVVSPFTWAAQYTGGRLVLSGHVPSEAARTELVAAARASLASGAVDDQMDPGGGAPQGFGAAAAAAVQGLAKLETGSADLRDVALVFAGVSADQASADAVRVALRAALPVSIKMSDQIRAREPPPPPPPPPVPKAPEPTPPQVKSEAPTAPAPVPTPSSPQVKAEQPPPPPPPSAPPASTTTPSREAAAPSPPAPPPPAPVAPPPPVVVPAPSPPAAAAPPPVPDAPRIASVGDPRTKSCEETLSLAAAAGTIQFRLGSSDLEDASASTLDRMAQAVKSCPGMRIVVGGHASSEGGSEINQQLSIRRAQSVVAYLVRAGVDTGQLEAVGYGVAQPIAPNDTSENMARNRRIEFVVRPK